MAVELASMAPDTYLEKVLEDAIETATKSASVDATYEEWPIITDLNTALTTAVKDTIPTGVRVKLFGVFEIIQGAAAAEYFMYSHGDVADGADTQRQYTTPAAADTYWQEATLFTDESGNIGIKIETVANITVKFHLESYQVVQYSEE